MINRDGWCPRWMCRGQRSPDDANRGQEMVQRPPKNKLLSVWGRDGTACPTSGYLQGGMWWCLVVYRGRQEPGGACSCPATADEALRRSLSGPSYHMWLHCFGEIAIKLAMVVTGLILICRLPQTNNCSQLINSCEESIVPHGEEEMGKASSPSPR